MKIGSLCTGYGGLDIAVEAYYALEQLMNFQHASEQDLYKDA